MSPLILKKIITFKITLKSIPAKLARFYPSPNIDIVPFRIKNNSKRNNMHKKAIEY